MTSGRTVTWGNLFEQWGNSFKLITTATTGLKPETDALLGVWAVTALPDGRVVDFKQAVCKVPDEVLANGAEYHKLTPSYLRSVGLPKAEFEASVAQILRDAVLLSYNPKFQSSFLQLPIFDVVKLKVIADMHLPHSDTITLSELTKIDARVPGIKQALRFAGIDTEELAKRYPVPAEASLQALALLWRKLCYTTFPVEQPETNYQPQAYDQQRACLS